MNIEQVWTIQNFTTDRITQQNNTAHSFMGVLKDYKPWYNNIYHGRTLQKMIGHYILVQNTIAQYIIILEHAHWSMATQNNT